MAKARISGRAQALLNARIAARQRESRRREQRERYAQVENFLLDLVEYMEVSYLNPSPLMFSSAWKELLRARDMRAYRRRFFSLIETTPKRKEEPWTYYLEEVSLRWMLAVERIISLAILEEDRSEMTRHEMLETALITLFTNLKEAGWIEKGLSWRIPAVMEMEEGVEALQDTIDLREIRKGKIFWWFGT